MPAPKGWDPMRVNLPPNPQTAMAKEHFATDGRKTHYDYRTPQRSVSCTAFGNRLYDGIALEFEDGSMHLSFKRKDRAAVRDWRHFQAIKNEVAGIDREAVEIYPSETNLTDAANEYHIWVLPPGKRMPWGLDGRGVTSQMPEQALDWAAYRTSRGTVGVGGRQREFEDNIPTGTPLADQIIWAAEKMLEAGWRPAEAA